MATTRQAKWADRIHRPIEADQLQAIRRSALSGLPYGDDLWVKRLAKKLDLGLAIRPRGRPRQDKTEK